MVRIIDRVRRAGDGIEIVIENIAYWVPFKANDTAEIIRARVKALVDAVDTFPASAFEIIKNSLIDSDIDK